MALLAQDVINFERETSNGGAGQCLASFQALDLCVLAVLWFGVYFDNVLWQDDQPRFRNPGASVQRKLDVSVVVRRGISDLDDQQHFRRCWMSATIRIAAGFEQSDIRLRL